MARTFQSERLTFYSLKEEDIPLIYALHSIAEVAEFNTIGIPETIETTRRIFAQKLDLHNQNHMGWVIRDHHQNFIGEMGLILAPARFKKAEISYSIHPIHWGKGYATEALNSGLHHAFMRLHLHRVEAGVAIENHKSIRVLEKAGLRREGQHRKILPLITGWSDNYTYAILSTDYKQVKQ